MRGLSARAYVCESVPACMRECVCARAGTCVFVQTASMLFETYDDKDSKLEETFLVDNFNRDNIPNDNFSNDN